MSDAQGRVTAIRIHPLKGARAIPLAEAVLDARGLAFDRHWMLVRPDGRFLTQRELPQLATIGTALDGEALVLELGDTGLRIPLDRAGEPLNVRIWDDTVVAQAQGDEVDEALTAWAGRAVRLVRFAPGTTRPCDPAFAEPGSHTEFADGFPLLVTSTASLAALNDALIERGVEPVPMERFRPNLVVDGMPAWAEDAARPLRIGSVVLDLVKPCERCSVTTTDQVTGERHGREPLATLQALGRKGVGGGPTFGWNAVPRLHPGERAAVQVNAPVHSL